MTPRSLVNVFLTYLTLFYPYQIYSTVTIPPLIYPFLRCCLIPSHHVNILLLWRRASPIHSPILYVWYILLGYFNQPILFLLFLWNRTYPPPLLNHLSLPLSSLFLSLFPHTHTHLLSTTCLLLVSYNITSSSSSSTSRVSEISSA